MRYPYLDQNSAREIITKRRAGEDMSPEDYIKFRGEGPDFFRATIKDLRLKLEELREKYPGKGRKFEAEACVSIQQFISGDILMFGDLDFWVYLAVIELTDFVEWRYVSEKVTHASLTNYGIGNRVENFIFRLWIRAEIAYRSELKEDKYALARKGDIDLWRSHILRQRYGNCRTLACALISYQYPHDDKKSRVSVKVLRELAKRLKRLYANLEYAFLNDEQAMRLIEREASIAMSSVRGAAT